jgi:Rab3 GTPase-activating protein catalytic subunit
MCITDSLSFRALDQVFNVCMESIVAAEMREIEELEKNRSEINGMGNGLSSRPSSGSIIDKLPDEPFSRREGDDSTYRTTKSMYFDADEGSMFSASSEKPTGRRGARCPVHGVNLVKTGDQVYAPYLQRPFPLTDDLIAQRQMMMQRQKGAKSSSTLRQRIEIAQRLQRPKLLSDMQAFKAANPGAVFQDFVSW